jgi:hypothetical protein
MRIRYAPEDADELVFDFKPRKLFSFDSEAIEDVGGSLWTNWDEFLSALAESKGRALRAVLWHERKKTNPDLTFDGVIVRPGELAAYYDDEEIAEMRELAKDPDTPEGIRQGIWAALGKGDAEEPSVTSDSDTASTSPTTG